LAYWERQLQDVPALDLPTTRPRPSVRTHAGTKLRFDIPAEILGPLRELGRQEGVTLFMTLLAAFNVLLHRYSGQDDLAVGTPIAGRSASETEALIGFFVNTLVMRTDLSGGPTVRQLLARVRETALQAYAHQDVPFEKLVDHLAPERDMSRSLLFQVMFSLQNTPDADWTLAGLDVRREPVPTENEKFDLTLTFDETAGYLKGAIGYQTDLFDASSIERMAGHLRRLLEEMAANPDARIGELEILLPDEAEQILRVWNRTERDWPRNETVHQRFERQARETPDRVAVIYESRQVTYAELNGRANQLARRLRAAGVGPDAPVGLCMDRSLEMIVGLLGILKAGGAYVPLDPHSPVERMKMVIEDARIGVVLGNRGIGDALDTPVLCLDEEWPSIAAHDDRDFDSGAGPENLAYVIFTSGSTGRPKGVAIAHQSVLNLQNALRDQVRVREEREPRRVGVNAPIVFDASVKQLIQLLDGATLVIVPEAVRESGKRLLALIEGEQLDLIDCTPSHLQVLIDEGLLQKPGMTTTFLVGGEKIGAAMWQRLCESKGASFYNVYGPTECTVDAALTAIGAGTGGPVIGRALWNATLYVLDREMQPVPVGVPGELFIGGAGLARGYVNRPDLTAERFVPSPFSASGGERLYRTGDAVRWREDGQIEYLDRIDQQVKIRGFRIELGEIESVLALHPDVAQAVVLVREDQPGDRRLVAYVVAEGGTEPLDLEALRDHLRSALPDYMIPAACVELEQLPRTVNGKVDRRKLLAVDVPRGDAAATFVLPTTPIEHLVAEIYADVLGLDEVGIHDNFFNLGGHSLLAMQLVARIGEILEIEVPLRFVFVAPTVAELAALLEDSRMSPTQMERIAAVYQQFQKVV
jgi:amino acid adenylation domain-containing protein